jgi:hypothetical protein
MSSKSKPKTKRICLMVYFRSKAELAAVRRAAKLNRQGTSTYIVGISLQRAKSDLGAAQAEAT